MKNLISAGDVPWAGEGEENKQGQREADTTWTQGEQITNHGYSPFANRNFKSRIIKNKG